jgi:hypothetical protein
LQCHVALGNIFILAFSVAKLPLQLGDGLGKHVLAGAERGQEMAVLGFEFK